MKVKIKKFAVDMEVKNAGIEFQVHGNAGVFLGDCCVTKTGLVWCRGKTTYKNGRKISCSDLIKLMEEHA